MTVNYAAALPVMRRARERIAKGWTQGYWARTVSGRECMPLGSHAVCWCIRGAIRYCARGREEDKEASDMLCGVLNVANATYLAAWNDAPGRTQAEVLALLDQAIRECEEKTDV